MLKQINSKNTALLVIDVTNRCCSLKGEIKKWGITFKKIRKMVPKLAEFVTRYKREFGGRVIYINCVKWEKEYLPENINKLYEDPRCRYYSKDHENPPKMRIFRTLKIPRILACQSRTAFSMPGMVPYSATKTPRNAIAFLVCRKGMAFPGIAGFGTVTQHKTGFIEKFYEVKPDKEDIIITKNNYDAFSNPKLDKLLKKEKIKYLAVTGVFGDGCVHATINGGFSKGYNFVMLKDLIETTDVEIRQKLQKLLKKFTWPMLFGKTIDSKDFLREIVKR